MKLTRLLVGLASIIVLLVLTSTVSAQRLAQWHFDASAGAAGAQLAVRDDISGERDTVIGNAWTVPGVVGPALSFDGITAHIVRKADKAPKLSGAFTLEAWLAIGAYPFNWCPIFQQQEGEKAGYFFGIGDQGQVSFRLAVNGKWQGAETSKHIALRQWALVTGVYEPGKRVSIYINGVPEATAPIDGEFTPADNADLWIAGNMTELEQTAPVSENRQAPTKIRFDGVLDEAAINMGISTPEDVLASYRKEKPGAPPIPARVLPAGPPGPAPFGAVYANLKYYKGWDDTWRVDDNPDVLVRFDETPYRFVFWRGTNYIPHWVTENGIWYDNEFTETFQKGLRGSAEPMSDKQCRFSHVRIIESNEARVVVHWRYAPIDVNYTLAYIDPLTGWGDVTDEVYTIYPDGVGVRKITSHTTDPRKKREWHEGIVVMGPGMTPNDALDPAGLTLVNDNGETHTYSWERETPPKKPTEPPNANIQLVNTKSKYRPFTLVRSGDQPWFDVYAGEIRREVSVYPWWNHWPTALEPSNGRYALAADRASSSSLTHIHWNDYASGKNWSTKIMLHGMTDLPAAQLAPIARSWDHPPKLQLSGNTFAGGEYDPAQRAYLLERKQSVAGGPLGFTIAASAESPVHNLALVIKGWGDSDATLAVNGKQVPRGKDFRLGRRTSLEGNDLVVWLRVESSTPTGISLSIAK